MSPSYSRRWVFSLAGICTDDDAALGVLAVVLIPPASAVWVRTASRIRAGIALGVAVGSLVAVYGGVILVVR